MSAKKFLEYKTNELILTEGLGDWTNKKVESSPKTTLNKSEQDAILALEKLTQTDLKQTLFLHNDILDALCKQLSSFFNSSLKPKQINSYILNPNTLSQMLESKKIVQCHYSSKQDSFAYLCFDLELASQMIHKLTGGSKEELNQKTFTSIELSLLKNTCEKLTEPLNRFWHLEDINMDLYKKPLDSKYLSTAFDHILCFEFTINFNHQEQQFFIIYNIKQCNEP